VHLRQHDRPNSQLHINIAMGYVLGALFDIALGTEREDRASRNPILGGVSAAAARLYYTIDADCAATLACGNTNNVTVTGADGRTRMREGGL
jgi:hypothetical protein